MTKNSDEKLENRRIIAKDWKLSDDLITNIARCHIEKYKIKNKHKFKLDDKELEKCLIDVVLDIGVGFNVYLGFFGKDYFSHILDNLTMKAIDDEIERRKNNGGM